MLRKQKFRSVQARPVDGARVRKPEPNDWRERRFEEREQARMAARNEAEAVDNRLRAGFSSSGGFERQAWGLADGYPPHQKESVWQRLWRTTPGMIPGWRSRRRT